MGAVGSGGGRGGGGGRRSFRRKTNKRPVVLKAVRSLLRGS